MSSNESTTVVYTQFFSLFFRNGSRGSNIKQKFFFLRIRKTCKYLCVSAPTSEVNDNERN